MADRVGVIVPWRAGCEHRQRALEWCRQRWPWPVVMGKCGEGSWRKAVAVADGLTKTDADVLVIADADVWCPTDGIVAAVADGLFEWGFPHRATRRLNEVSTSTLIVGRLDPLDVNGSHLVEPGSRAHPGGGIVVITRAAYERCPLDPRFENWGHEDDSWGWALETLAGAPCRGRERLLHLWHPPQERKTRQRGSDVSYGLQERYWAAYGRSAVMAALIEEARGVTAHGC